MSLVRMLNFYGFVVFICLTSVLTSTADKETTGTDDISHKSTASTGHVSLEKNDHISTLSASLSSANINPIKNTDNNIVLEGEGGPIYAKHKSVLSTDEDSPSREKASTETINMAEGKDGTRTETETRIVPRKGADQLLVHTKAENISLENVIDNKATKPVFEPSTVTESVNKQQQVMNSSTGVVNTKATTVQPNVVKTDDKEHVSLVTSAPEVKVSVSETPKPTHKPKPTLTIGESGKDKPVRIVPTKSTLSGMPRKIDYIVPIVITVVALPLLAATALIMYRRGRDCWDKRHYRRMDFLIDGMYND